MWPTSVVSGVTQVQDNQDSHLNQYLRSWWIRSLKRQGQEVFCPRKGFACSNGSAIFLDYSGPVTKIPVFLYFSQLRPKLSSRRWLEDARRKSQHAGLRCRESAEDEISPCDLACRLQQLPRRPAHPAVSLLPVPCWDPLFLNSSVENVCLTFQNLLVNLGSDSQFEDLSRHSNRLECWLQILLRQHASPLPFQFGPWPQGSKLTAGSHYLWNKTFSPECQTNDLIESSVVTLIKTISCIISDVHGKKHISVSKPTNYR